MQSVAKQVDDAATVVRSRWSGTPRVGIILGTGLATFAHQIERQLAFDYEDIPHFPRSTAMGHHGRLVCGDLGGTPVVTMDGRFHLYEGYSLQQITLPVRVMRALGIEILIVSNASGGLNPKLSEGDIVVLEDHIDLLGANPLTGINDDRLGSRFPDMCRPYDRALCAQALEIARRENFAATAGVYVGLCGPCYETRAEYRFLRAIGGDVVGMSTVPEVIVAVHAGLRVLGLSVVTNVCRPDALEPTDGQRVLRAAHAAEHKICKIARGILTDLDPSANQAPQSDAQSAGARSNPTADVKSTRPPRKPS
ncbi:MAG: purine-nucleoside phosphorylase [Pirellulales bacterium]